MNNENWYKGTADAVAQNIDIIRGYAPKYIIILAGDHIYKQDYSLMVKHHVESGADVTVGCIEVPRLEASGFGVMKVDETDKIFDFVEKPADPSAMPGHPDMALASMGIYVFETEYLCKSLQEESRKPGNGHDFGGDITPAIVANGLAVAHPFSRSCVRSGLEEQPYWRDVGTVDAFWQANVDLTDFKPELDLYDNTWPIWTYSELTALAKFTQNEEGRKGHAVSSMVLGGCIISGSTLNRCFLFTGVRTHSFSELEGVVAMPYAEIGRSAKLKNVVIDRGVKIPDGLIVGEDKAMDEQRFRRTANGIGLITQPMIDRLDR